MTLLFRTIALLLALLASAPVTAAAHEVRPASLTLEEVSPGVFDVTWKQPVSGGRRLAMDPVLPDECLGPGERTETRTGAAWLASWQVSCALKTGRITIAGLERTLTDVFVSVRYLDGERIDTLLRPGGDPLDLGEAPAGAAASYVRLGFEHILSGPDHLLFVLGLLILAPLRRLFWVVTGFTIAHSLTLAATAFGLVSLPSGPVEILIALSILLLGVEAVRVLNGEPSLAARRPWLVSFGFGLLHGFGFAGALAEIGLPSGQELGALLFFNIGVEAGQVAFIAVVLAAALLAVRGFRADLSLARRAVAFGVGTIGAFWVFERLGSTFYL